MVVSKDVMTMKAHGRKTARTGSVRNEPSRTTAPLALGPHTKTKWKKRAIASETPR